jgi:UDP-glucose 4-epimerase
MTNVLITGANGFIGRHLADWLGSRNYQVCGLGNPGLKEADKNEKRVNSIDEEISFDSLDRICRDANDPEIIFHLAGGSSVGAALADPHRDYLRTVHSTSVLLEWMRLNTPGSRLVAVSSAAVYGAGHERAIRESTVCNPYSPYGAHKFMMEILCRSYAGNFNLQVVIPRLFSVYGEGLRKQLLWDLCNKLTSKGKIELGGSGDELRDWTHVSDIVKGLEKVADLASNQSPLINLATGIGTPVRDIASMVATCWDEANAPQRIAFSGHARIGDPFSLVADIAELHSKSIHCGKPLDEGIADYVGWFLDQKQPD